MLADSWLSRYRRCGLGGSGRWCFGPAFFEPHDYDIEHRREKKAKAGNSEHSEKDRGAEGLSHFRAGTRTNDQRNDAEDERERSHQDRTQSKTTCFDRGCEAIFLIAVL